MGKGESMMRKTRLAPEMAMMAIIARTEQDIHSYVAFEGRPRGRRSDISDEIIPLAYIGLTNLTTTLPSSALRPNV